MHLGIGRLRAFRKAAGYTVEGADAYNLILKGWRLLLIELHRLNGDAFLLNSDMIETVEVTPDTVLRLMNGHRYIVKEKVRDVYKKIVAFRKAAGYTCIIANTADESKE